ncbi:DUF4126 domain-containing protein [Motiliproteus sp. MSK22-1]|uniref:DUF4126 domain-containing protein n=1 Tax=Motiliproteus sp. MSK22-1 TaxID=1897630 RepID=UPI000978C421|nr:DUF4126 domain-containing protein [Motiliproteus sp. MSK22-1]OMH30070.1 hypothetical protein BGP75_19260 [Motiliproteus sp. MSK22-1]
MEQLDSIITMVALTMGVGWASGINLYATLLMLGFMANTGNIDLPPDLQVLANPMVISAAALMYAVEFFADKVPGVDSGWDALHTFIRIPAGAALAAGAVGDVSGSVELAAAIVGGGLAASSHAVKAGGRVMINTSPEPFTNWFASLGEDVAVIAGVWAALNHPYVFLAGLLLFILLLIWLLPKIARGIARVFGFLLRFFRSEKPLVDDYRKISSGSDKGGKPLT